MDEVAAGATEEWSASRCSSSRPHGSAAAPACPAVIVGLSSAWAPGAPERLAQLSRMVPDGVRAPGTWLAARMRSGRTGTRHSAHRRSASPVRQLSWNRCLQGRAGGRACGRACVRAGGRRMLGGVSDHRWRWEREPGGTGPAGRPASPVFMQGCVRLRARRGRYVVEGASASSNSSSCMPGNTQLDAREGRQPAPGGDRARPNDCAPAAQGDNIGSH